MADICVLAFDEFVATPASPSWDPYKSAPSGKFFEMVQDVYKAVGIKGTAREFARQSAEAFAKEGKKNLLKQMSFRHYPAICRYGKVLL